jgi:probable HAF family extracellular repeat protein
MEIKVMQITSIDLLSSTQPPASDVVAINASGTATGTVGVVGTDRSYDQSTLQPCTWGAGAYSAKLIQPDSRYFIPTAIHDSGLIVGYQSLQSGDGWAALLDPTKGKVAVLPQLVAGSVYGYAAYGVNDTTAVGFVTLDNPKPFGPQIQVAVSWNITPAITSMKEKLDLPQKLGLDAYTYSVATAVSKTGHICGYAGKQDGGTAAFLYTPNGGVQDLGHLGGNSSQAQSVNSEGSVVGWSQTQNGEVHGFVWRKGTNNGNAAFPEMMDLGTLPGENYSEATFIDEKGVVFGASGSADQSNLTATVSELVGGSPHSQLIRLVNGRYIGAPKPSIPPMQWKVTGVSKALLHTRPYGPMQPVLRKWLLPGDFYPHRIRGGNNAGQIVGLGMTAGAAPTDGNLLFRMSYVPY